MTATLPDTIDHLDFDQNLPCEAERHPHDGPDLPAAWAVDIHCPGCKHEGRSPYLVCDYWLRHAENASYVRCIICDHKDDASSFITNVRPLL